MRTDRRRARQIWAPAGALLALALSAAGAPALARADSFAPSPAIALSATHVLGLSSLNPCPSGDPNHILPQVSEDRGGTWGNGPACIMWAQHDPPVLDPRTGEIDYIAGDPGQSHDPSNVVPETVNFLDAYGRPLTTKPDGTPLPDGTPAPPNTIVSYAAEGGVVYAISSVDPAGNGPMSLWRVERNEAAPTQCPATGADLSGTGWEVLSLYGAILIDNRDGAAGHAYLSLDGCATFQDVTPPGDCDELFYASSFAFYALCSDAPTVRKLDLRNLAAGWQWAEPLLANNPLPAGGITLNYAYGIEGDERFVHTLDQFSYPTWPAGWPPPAAPPAPPPAVPPPPALQPLFDLIDNQYRRPLGLPDLSWNDAAAQSAQAHANYYLQNGFTGEDETDGSPGFTGEDADARCYAVGIDNGCEEVSLGGGDDLATAAQVWLDQPDNGLVLLTRSMAGFGASTAGEVGDFPFVDSAAGNGGFSPPPIIDLAAPINAPNGNLAVWPYDGAQNVPINWTDSPDSLALGSYSGDPNNIGPVFYIAGILGANLTLTGPDGAIPLFFAGDGSPASPLHFDDDNSEWLAFMPTQQLRPNADYQLAVQRDDNGQVTVMHFHTAGAPLVAAASGSSSSSSTSGQASPGTKTATARCTVAPYRYKRHGYQFLRWRSKGPCARKALIQRFSRSHRWKRLKQPLLLDRGEVVRWRGIWLHKVVAHGVYHAPRPPVRHHKPAHPAKTHKPPAKPAHPAHRAQHGTPPPKHGR